MKTLKTLLVVAVVSVVAGSSLFASPTLPKTNETKITASVENPMVTICGKIKASKSGYKIEAKNGKTYIIDIDPSSDVPSIIFKNRKNKLLIVTGYANDETGIFTVEKIGGIIDNSAEK